MKVGASRYHPGLTVRWNDIGDDWASLFAPRIGCLLMIAKASSWAVSTFVPPLHHWQRYDRRCDAKRAAEVLVGQWWREKCEREALAADYNARLLAAFRGENHGTGVVDVAARALAERARVGAGQPVFATGRLVGWAMGE